MIIGCYDADMSKYIHTPFNLELMKIAGYYKRKREIVLLSPSIELEKASKVFYSYFTPFSQISAREMSAGGVY